MSATVQPQPAVRPGGHPAERQLRQRLSGLRRRMRMVALMRGLGWLVLCVLATVVAVGLLDYRFHLPGLVRAFLLMGLLVGAGVVALRYLIQPLAQPADDLALALRIEERYPLLNDGLASTVEFLQRTPPEGESASMRGEAVRRTLGKVAGLDFHRVIDAQGLRTAIAGAAAALAAAVLLGLLYPTLAATAVARLASPFGSLEWPRKTRFELERVVLRIGRNREYRLRGTLHGVIPPEVTADIQNEGFPTQHKSLAVHPDDHTFTLHLRPEEIQRNFVFQLHANDASTEEFRVEVLPLPILVPLQGSASPQIRLAPPAYTDLPPAQLQPGMGNLEVVAGTLVTLRAATDRPLRRAWIEYQPEQAGANQAACLAVFGTQEPLGVLSAFALSRGVYERIPATLEGDGRQFEAVFRPSTNGSYGLHFEDEHELENSRTYELRLRLDPAPTVKLERPSPTRDVLSVLPTAELPLTLLVEDSQFAVRSVWLEYRTQPEEAPRARVLFDGRRGVEAGPWAGSAFRGAEVPRLRPTRLEFERKLALRQLQHPNGSPLKEGDVVLLQACADDFDDVSIGKEPGRSHQVTIRIVGREALDVQVNQEQGRIQKELLGLRDKQREALQKVREIEARVRKGEKMLPDREAAEAEAQAARLDQEAQAERDKAEASKNPAEREKHQQQARDLKQKAQQLEARAQELKRQATQFAEAEQLQQQVRERVGNEREGLRAEIERLRETLRQNNLDNSNAMERMNQVARELNRLAGKELEHIEPQLTNARKLGELQDERSREERRAELEQRAKTAEQEARAAEDRANKQQERAAQLEKDGNAEEAARERQKAEQERQKAAERRAAAERERREAAEAADPERARRSLADARRGQEEVERSLNQLLQELEPWSSTLEVNSEAGRILQEQKELMAQLEEMEKKGLTGKNRDELTEGEKADLDGAQESQRRLQERTANLLQQMKKLAEARAQKDAEMANDLQKAAEKAEENNLTGQMKAAQENISRNELNQARKKQQEALAELEQMVKNLKDSRENRLDRLARKLRETEEMVEKLMDEQERLQRKMREAGRENDPKKREEELQRLAKKQKELQKQTEEAMNQAARLGNDRARQMMQEAQEDQGDVAKQLARGQKEEEKQEDALDRLEEARRELEQARKKAEEELGREQLVRVADVIRRIRERQEGHLQEAKRVQDGALERKGWSRGLKASLRDLGQNQQGLAGEAVTVARKDLSDAPIFAQLVERSARAMEKASQRLASLVRETPALEALPDAELKRDQAEALRRLDQLLASLKEALDEPRPLSRGDNGEDGGAGGGGGGGGDDSLPPKAQLKLLRSLQQEVNERTAEFHRKHPVLDNLPPKEKQELDELRREQKEVGDLLDRLVRPAGEGDEPPAREANEGERP